jgi:hypothetical protein
VGEDRGRKLLKLSEDRGRKLLKLRGVVNEGDRNIDAQRAMVDLV